MSKKNWARGVWAVTSFMAGSVAIAGLPQQNANNANDAGVGQPTGAIQRTDDANPNRGNARMGQHQDVDRFVVKCLIQANKDEIATARLAEQRSTNQDVKSLASQMVEDHTKFLGKLQQFQGEHRGQQNGETRRRGANDQDNNQNNGTLNNSTPNNNGVNNTQGNATQGNSTQGNATQGENNTQGGNSARGAQSQNQTAAPTTGNAVTQTSASSSDTANDHNATEQRPTTAATNQPATADQLTAPGTVDERGVAGKHFARNQQAGMNAHAGAAHFVKIMEEVAQQNQQSMARELSQKEGVQFDRCYLHGQIAGHTWMVDALTVFQRNASSELQPLLQEGLQSTQQHLTHAKALMMRIDQQAKTTASR